MGYYKHFTRTRIVLNRQKSFFFLSIVSFLFVKKCLILINVVGMGCTTNILLELIEIKNETKNI